MARSDIVRAGATPEFVTLCKTLYGDLIDPDEIWYEVIKASPDQADLHAAASARRRNNFERGSNAVGFTAGLMATGSALRDDRFGPESTNSKVANRLHAAANKIPKPISGIKGRTGAGLAAGALGVQGLNIAGDAAIGTSYNDRAKLKPTGRQKGVKSAAASSGLFPTMKNIVAGVRKQTNNILGTPSTASPATPNAGGQSLLPGLDHAAVPNAPGRVGRAAAKMGGAVKDATSTSTGRSGLVVGATGTLAAQQGAKKAKKKYGQGSSEDYYGKSADDVEWRGTFSKVDEDKQLAFGWASVSKVNGQPVVDKQGDYIDPADLEDAAYKYVLHCRVGGGMHKRDEYDQPIATADLVESMVFTDDKVAKMGLPDSFNRGWWVGMKIHDPEEWSLIKKGSRTGFSVHGKGIRKDIDEDELMYGSY